MPWQQYVADVILEIDPVTGRLAYDEFGLTVPRQSGKSTFVLAKFIHRGMATGFFGPRQQLIYTAQTRKKAKEKWREDYVAEVEASAAFRHKIRPSYGSGEEYLRFPNGSRFAIEANTEKAGHGGTLDEAYIDEAFAQVDGRLEQAFSPAMITRRNTQLAWISTAGWLGGSPFLEPKVKRGREQAEMGVREGLAYFEWSAPEDADPEDRAVWRGCMPALGHTIDENDIAKRLAGLKSEGKLNDFKRAYLNLWVPKTAPAITTAIDLAEWSALAAPSSRPVHPVLAVAVAQDRSWAALAAAWRVGDKVRVEVIRYAETTTWVPAAVAKAQSEVGARLVVLSQTAKGLIPDAKDVKDASAAVQVVADNALADAVTAGTLEHGDQGELTTSIRSSEWVKQGDTQRLERRGAADISPLTAAALAVHALTSEPPRGGWMVGL